MATHTGKAEMRVMAVTERQPASSAYRIAEGLLPIRMPATARESVGWMASGAVKSARGDVGRWPMRLCGAGRARQERIERHAERERARARARVWTSG